MTVEEPFGLASGGRALMDAYLVLRRRVWQKVRVGWRARDAVFVRRRWSGSLGLEGGGGVLERTFWVVGVVEPVAVVAGRGQCYVLAEERRC